MLLFCKTHKGTDMPCTGLHSVCTGAGDLVSALFNWMTHYFEMIPLLDIHWWEALIQSSLKCQDNKWLDRPRRSVGACQRLSNHSENVLRVGLLSSLWKHFSPWINSDGIVNSNLLWCQYCKVQFLDTYTSSLHPPSPFSPFSPSLAASIFHPFQLLYRDMSLWSRNWTGLLVT